MSGGRIEIPMSEYKGMKERIEELEKELAEKNKKLEKVTSDYLDAQLVLEDLSEISLYNRIFNWKENFNMIVKNEE
jgi:predicted nuclease with TOPRIM domain